MPERRMSETVLNIHDGMKHFARIAQVQEYDNVFIVDRRR
jgi:hypothetical protein